MAFFGNYAAAYGAYPYAGLAGAAYPYAGLASAAAFPYAGIY